MTTLTISPQNKHTDARVKTAKHSLRAKRVVFSMSVNVSVETSVKEPSLKMQLAVTNYDFILPYNIILHYQAKGNMSP